MEGAVRLLMIRALKAQLATCELETSALAKEIVSSSTQGTRRSEALIRRANIQTRSVGLQHKLEALEAGWPRYLFLSNA